MKDSDKPVNEIINEVKHIANRELDLCNVEETPAICQMIHSPKGREKIVNLIVEYVGKRGISVSEAIVLIERERTDLD